MLHNKSMLMCCKSYM